MDKHHRRSTGALHLSAKRKRRRGTSLKEYWKIYILQLKALNMSNFLKRVFNTHRAKRWACIKLFIFCGCFAGFAYQAMEFMRHYWANPTVLNLMIEKRRDAIEPAMTFCNPNSILRSKFCNKYPHLCEHQNKSSRICTLYPRYCEDSDEQSLVPRIEIFTLETAEYKHGLTLEDFIELGPSVHSFLKKVESFGRNYGIQGPYLVRDYFLHYHSVCFTIHSRLYDDVEAPKINYMKNTGIGFIFDFEVSPNETFYPWTIGLFFHIHSPFEVGFGYEGGILLKPGTGVRINVKLEEEHLLPYPYQTDCIDYAYVWESKNKTGPRSKGMCDLRCDEVELLKTVGCYTTYAWWPAPMVRFAGTMRNWCQVEEEEKADDVRTCKRKCKDDCLKLKYSYTTREGDLNPVEGFHKFQNSNKVDGNVNRNLIKVVTWIRTTEISIRSHEPKYKDVEQFSAVGGFLGIWLGISLFSVAGIIKSTCTYLKSKLKVSKHLSNLVEA